MLASELKQAFGRPSPDSHPTRSAPNQALFQQDLLLIARTLDSFQCGQVSFGSSNVLLLHKILSPEFLSILTKTQLLHLTSQSRSNMSSVQPYVRLSRRPIILAM
jgi:hypothetical protein